MKFLTLALVPIIIFVVFYVVAKLLDWGADRGALGFAVYMAVGLPMIVLGLMAVVACVAFPFVSA